MLVALAPVAPQRATFSASVEAVRVDVLVTANGKALLGLRPEDFEVRDNGVPQRVDLASFGQMPLNVILALDVSESVAGERLEHMQAAGAAIIGALEKQDQVALVTFNQVVSLAAPLSSEWDKVRTAIAGLRTSGTTALLDAIYSGIVLGESDVGRSLLIVLTDGTDTCSFLPQEAVLDTAQRTDVVVYGVTVGGGGRTTRLDDIVEGTGGRLIVAETTRDLPKVFVAILQEFRHRYLISYTPALRPRAGWHRLDVRVKGRGATVKARPGYMAGIG